MEQKTLFILLNSLQISAEQLDSEADLLEEQLCNCSKKNPNREMLAKKLSQVKSQIADLNYVFIDLSLLVSPNSIIKSHNVNYFANFDDDEFAGIQVR